MGYLQQKRQETTGAFWAHVYSVNYRIEGLVKNTHALYNKSQSNGPSFQLNEDIRISQSVSHAFPLSLDYWRKFIRYTVKNWKHPRPMQWENFLYMCYVWFFKHFRKDEVLFKSTRFLSMPTNVDSSRKHNRTGSLPPGSHVPSYSVLSYSI